MQLITHSTTQDTGEGGPLIYKSIGNQSQLQVTAQRHTHMHAAGHVKRLDTPIPMVAHNPYSPMHGKYIQVIRAGQNRQEERRQKRREGENMYYGVASGL